MKKYGRTYHLPISPGATADDKTMGSISGLTEGELVITEKMDGENTTIHRGGMHARSLDSRHHSSRGWVKGFAAGISHRLGENERIVGENVYARHSIAYETLPSYFLGFCWIIGDEVQSWDATLERFASLGITPVPTLYRGSYKDGLFEGMAGALDMTRQEGFVVRVAGSFTEEEMRHCMGKYVRENHVQSDDHWMSQAVVPNGLIDKA